MSCLVCHAVPVLLLVLALCGSWGVPRVWRRPCRAFGRVPPRCNWVLYISIYYILIIARRQAPAQGARVWGLESRDELQERRGHAGDPRGQQRARMRDRLPPGPIGQLMNMYMYFGAVKM